MTYGKSFLSAILAEGSVSALVGYGQIETVFKASEIDAYAFVREFALKYGKLPTAETIEKHTGQLLAPAIEPASYYYEQMTKRHIDLTLRQAMKEAQAQLISEQPNPEAAFEIVMAGVMTLLAVKHGKQVSDYRSAKEAILMDYVSKWQDQSEFGLQLGWPYLDALSGGLRKGDLVSYVGRPGQGKTWSLLYGAMHGWAMAGENAEPGNGQSRMFVSMEMDVLPIQERLAAMHTHLSMHNVKHAELGTPGLIKLRDGLIEIKTYGAPFYVVDGAYLVKHPTERDRYRRVAENAELMKKELASIAPVACSWQFAKSAAKKNKKAGEKPDLDDIGSSVAIGQVSSIVLGIFEEENVETLKQRRVEVLKGRSGEVGEFRTRWDFNQMHFGEIVEETGGEGAEDQDTSHENQF